MGKLQFFGKHAKLSDAKAFAAYLSPLRNSKWVVYCKRPFGGPKEVLRYLARYTHRVAFSNRRLVACDEKGVTFKWKDYRIEGPERYKLMTLPAHQFIRRFLMHVLPAGFHRIRYFGFLCNRQRASKLARCRVLLGMQPPDPAETSSCPPADYRALYQSLTGTSLTLCPACGKGQMLVIEVLGPADRPPWVCDTS